MSVVVELAAVRDEIDRRGPRAFVITVSDDGRPHAVATTVTCTDEGLVARSGHRTTTNATARPLVTLLWPSATDDDYSFIVDGHAEPGGDGEIVVSPTSAVLHRPGPAPEDKPDCTADCVRL